MRIRLPFAGVFTLLVLLSAYAGLSTLQLSPSLPLNDKALHFLAFFLLTLAFYWVIDTTRRRTLNLTLAICTAGGGVGSEILQGLLPNGREFDPYDVIANLVGSLAAVGLCSWYHKRMLERKRQRRYGGEGGGGGVSGDGDGEELERLHGGEQQEEEEDLELGEGRGLGRGFDGQEQGVTTFAAAPVGTRTQSKSLEEEVDNWDENEVDNWDDEEEEEEGESEEDIGGVSSAGGGGKVGVANGKKRAD
ncbi:hypothetical protein QBC41DRAFT_311278 [Cercophora samala]|uniref:VanZ-like domain-containing protein n=1 Tax=Cercophora samala TaxID=330535 RepID=A0AA39ZM54_9PEZI|nr:hypothetical protein QBC41DRAFT_311278 [Cercophora samala]